MDPAVIIDFWFATLQPTQWFRTSPDVDNLIRERFSAVHRAASLCETFPWRQHATGCLAEILVLDQFSRNIYRGTPKAFETDSLALALAQSAVFLGQDLHLSIEHRAFVYMPYMHSESREIHKEAVRLFSAPGLEKSLSSELKHLAIIDRFGRFPHRNTVLGRPSTPDERAFLQEPGSSF
jgi:uncharacterized protein (DUF924 family)